MGIVEISKKNVPRRISPNIYLLIPTYPRLWLFVATSVLDIISIAYKSSQYDVCIPCSQLWILDMIRFVVVYVICTQFEELS